MKPALVITSIALAPNGALQKFSKVCQENHIPFYLIGDTKSPAEFPLPGCEFWNISQQDQLPFALSKILPKKHYSRKNIGYLLAMQAGHDVIFESDDDNFPLENFFNNQSMSQQAYVIENQGWTNVYRYYSSENIWPRGFPLQYIKNSLPEKPLQQQRVLCPIQQGLANENPDVDAIYRLTGNLPVSFTGKDNVALGHNTWCPFNTQNTVFFKPAFPLLYLPSTCNVRLTDIWRSFVAQRIAWVNHWHILFTPANVYQERNEHDLMIDFAQEVEMYLHNQRLCQALQELDLLPGEEFITQNMLRCYQRLIDMGFIMSEEIKLLNGWFDDVGSLLGLQKCTKEYFS